MTATRTLPMARIIDVQDQDALALHGIKTAIQDYHFALDSRQHGDTAAHDAIKTIEAILGLEWWPGHEQRRRAVMAEAKRCP